jgi:hypothetical protein
MSKFLCHFPYPLRAGYPRLDYQLYGIEEVLPLVPLCGQFGGTLGRNIIVASLPAIGQHLPLPRDQARFLKAVKGWIKGAFFEFKVALASRFELLNNLITVHWLLL